MKRRTKVALKRLDQSQEEFRPLLVSCLRECAAGRLGLFGQHDGFEDARWLSWPEADRLKILARQIRSGHRDAGTRNDLCEQFLDLCSLRGPNVPGEPKLAKAFLTEIGEA